MKIQIIIKNKYGEYKSKAFHIVDEDYPQVIELAKNFYHVGYEMETEEGYLVIPPDITKDSILLVEKI